MPDCWDYSGCPCEEAVVRASGKVEGDYVGNKAVAHIPERTRQRGE